MKRVWMRIAPAVLALFVLAGCGGPPTAEDVKLGDLDDHKGSGDYEQSDWDGGDVEGDFDEALEMILESLGDIEVEERSLSVDTFRNMLLGQLEKGASVKTAYMEDLSNPDEETFGLKFVIDDEVIDESSNPSVASGSLEIPDFVMEYELRGEGDDFEGRLLLDLLMDGNLEAADYLYDDGIYDVVVDHGILRIGSAGDAEISWDESQYSLKYSFYLDFKIGLSVHSQVTGRGGKMLLNLHYDESYDDSISSSEFSGLSEGDFSAAPISGLRVDFEVYGNDSSTPLFSDTYDENDIINLSENLMSALGIDD